jgi:hypothetical protein
MCTRYTVRARHWTPHSVLAVIQVTAVRDHTDTYHFPYSLVQHFALQWYIWSDSCVVTRLTRPQPDLRYWYTVVLANSLHERAVPVHAHTTSSVR